MYKVKCIVSEGARNITIGKTYWAREADSIGYMQIKNDNGEWKSYHETRFARV